MLTEAGGVGSKIDKINLSYVVYRGSQVSSLCQGFMRFYPNAKCLWINATLKKSWVMLMPQNEYHWLKFVPNHCGIKIPKKKSHLNFHFYLIERGNLNGNSSGNCR